MIAKKQIPIFFLVFVSFANLAISSIVLFTLTIPNSFEIGQYGYTVEWVIWNNPDKVINRDTSLEGFSYAQEPSIFRFWFFWNSSTNRAFTWQVELYKGSNWVETLGHGSELIQAFSTFLKRVNFLAPTQKASDYRFIITSGI